MNGNGQRDSSIPVPRAKEHLEDWDKRVRFGTVTFTKREGQIVFVEEHNTWKDAEDLPNGVARSTSMVPGVRK